MIDNIYVTVIVDGNQVAAPDFTAVPPSGSTFAYEDANGTRHAKVTHTSIDQLVDNKRHITLRCVGV